MAMDNDPVFCFQHCQTDANLLCLELPSQCPVCSQNVYQTPLKIPPFRLPSPFFSASEKPYSIVLKPTNGNFLSDYQNDANLHIGITDSRGIVYHYNEQGVHKSDEDWTQCLSVTIITRAQYRLASVWDTKLIEFSAYDQWSTQRYSEGSNNCYTFVVAYLELLQQYSPLNLTCRLTKTDIVQSLVLPQTVLAAKYIDLYRKVLNEGVVIQYDTTL